MAEFKTPAPAKKRRHEFFKWTGGAGRIGKWIGTGKHAKHSLAFIVLIWVMIAGGLCSVMIVGSRICFSCYDKAGPDLGVELKMIWEFVTPIVTLVLGYEFGRNEK